MDVISCCYCRNELFPVNLFQDFCERLVNKLSPHACSWAFLGHCSCFFRRGLIFYEDAYILDDVIINLQM